MWDFDTKTTTICNKTWTHTHDSNWVIKTNFARLNAVDSLLFVDLCSYVNYIERKLVNKINRNTHIIRLQSSQTYKSWKQEESLRTRDREPWKYGLVLDWIHQVSVSRKFSRVYHHHQNSRSEWKTRSHILVIIMTNEGHIQSMLIFLLNLLLFS